MRTTWRPHAPPRMALGGAMTPMIDVVFLLLIFFVCTASFQPVETLLPSALVVSGASDLDAPLEEDPQLERVLLTAEPAGEGPARWSVNEAPCPDLRRVAELLAELAAIDRTLPVVVDPHRRVRLGDVIDVYDLARRAGFADVKFAASADDRAR